MGNKKVIREYSAGGVVFKKVKNNPPSGGQGPKIVWLVTQPRAEEEHWRKGRWQLPKGWIEEGESSRRTAIRETEEEGGVEVELIKKIDDITFFFYNEKKDRIAKNVVFYLMKWLRDKKEGPDKKEIDQVLWLSFAEAEEKLTFKSEKKILTKAKEALAEYENQPRLI